MGKKANKQFLRTIIIVCEDAKVTPGYLKGFKELLLDADGNIWEEISIYPLPIEESGTVTNKEQHKSQRKKRTFEVVDKEPAFQIEPEYKGVPVRYVREVQLRIEEMGYDEGWAVYDKDGHPRHAEAYQLSLTDPGVNIAFTSIAVEHWFLLHFEKNNEAFEKSKDVPLQKYIPNYSSKYKAKQKIFDDTIRHLPTAFRNAAWLRSVSEENAVPFYERNPYVNIDILILRLLGHEIKVPGAPIIIKGITIDIVKNGTSYNFSITNNSNASIFSDQITFFENNIAKRIGVENVLIVPGASRELTFESTSLLQLYVLVHHNKYIVDFTL